MLLEKLETASGEIEVIYASGGFSQSKWWIQMMADILQKPLPVNEKDADASALGAIAIGLKSEQQISEYSDFSVIIPTPYARYTPTKSTYDLYQYNYQHFCRLCQF